MDTPDPIVQASSSVKPSGVTPNSTGFPSPIPFRLGKTGTQPRRRAVRQRAKASYHDPDDSSDGGQDHSNDDKLPARSTGRKGTPHLIETDSETRSTGAESLSGMFHDMAVNSSKATNLDLDSDHISASIEVPGKPMITPTPVIVSSPVLAPSPSPSLSPLITPPRPVKGSALDAGNENTQNLNPFSLAAVPPSGGNSPPTTNGSGAATKKPSAKQTAKRPKSQHVRRKAQRQKKATKNQPKEEMAKLVELSLESSSTSEHDNGGNFANGQEGHEGEKAGRPTIPRKTNLKFLKSPVNPDIAATQDIEPILSSPGSPSVENDDGKDGEFVPTSIISSGTQIHQPKTRAATRAGKAKEISSVTSPSKATDVNTRRREVEVKPATDLSAPEVKLSEHSKQPINVAVTHETHVGKTGSKPKPKPKPKGQGKTAVASVVPPPSKTLQQITADQDSESHTFGSHTQHEKDLVASKPGPPKPRQRKAPQMDKPGQARQAGIAGSDDSRDASIIAFDRDGPKNNGRSQHQIDAPMLPPDRATMNLKRRPMAPRRDMPNQRPGKTVPKLHNDCSGLESRTSRHQVTIVHLNHGPVAVADQEHSASTSASEDPVRDEPILNPTLNDRTLIDHGEATADEWGVDCVDDGYGMEIAELLAHDFKNSIAADDHNHNYYDGIPETTVKYPSEPQKAGSSQKYNPNPAAKGTRALKRPPNAVAPLTNDEPLTKKARYEAVDTAPNSQDEDLLKGSAMSHTLAATSSDDVFDAYRNSTGRAKETSFLRRCIESRPQNYSQLKIQAKEPTRNQLANEGVVVHDKQRQPIQFSDRVAQRMLAAMSTREGLPQPAHDDTRNGSGHNSNNSILAQPPTKNVDERRGTWKKETEPYGEGLGEVMHKAVNVILRTLKTKEDAIGDVVDDYAREGRRIVDRMSAKHARERKQLVQQYEQSRAHYLQVCVEARRETRVISKDLKLVKLDQIMAKTGQDPAIDRLKELQKMLAAPGRSAITDSH